jgi:hypothetical protein
MQKSLPPEQAFLFTENWVSIDFLLPGQKYSDSGLKLQHLPYLSFQLFEGNLRDNKVLVPRPRSGPGPAGRGGEEGFFRRLKGI